MANNMRTLHRSLLLGAAVLAAGHGTLAFAQDSAGSGNGGIKDIVVTAEKRETSVQKTAIAITAYDKEAIARNGVNTLQDLATIAPGTSFGKNSANVIVTIRGVSSQNTNEIGDPAVSISQDGFYIQKPFGFADSMYDLERIEVLRGPQGTLYGRNATGGAINIITAKPVDKFEARVSAGVGNYDAITTEGMINVPVTSTLAVRASFATVSHDGYRRNEAPARAGDDADTKSGRVIVSWKPTDRLKMALTTQLTKVSGVGPTVEGYALRYTSTGAIDNNYRPTVDGNGVSHGNPNQYIDTTTRTVQWNGDYDLGFATFTYLGGYRQTDYAQLRDLDGTVSSNSYILPTEHVNDWSNEVRLVSNNPGRFKWQIGGYAFSESETLNSLYQSYATSSTPTNIFVFDYDVAARSKAVFGQASYELLDGLKAEAGIRYSHDYKSRIGYSNTGSGNVAQNDNSTSSKVTYHLALNWQATARNLLYAKFDTGYKAGGFNTVPGQNTLPYGPETIKAWEIGSKNRFWDGKAQLNATGFYYDYTNQQVTVRDQTVGLSAVFNAGSSHIYGTELEGILQPTTADKFDASIVWLHARYKDLCINKSTTGVCLTSYAGNTSPQSPDWQIGAGYEHRFDVFGGTLTPRIQTHFESHSYLGIENYGYEYQGAYTRSDIIVTFKNGDGRWNLQGYVRNLENAAVITSAVASTRFGTYSYGLQAPRTYGAKLTYSF
jgi:iron complex outermembrane receptor protein